MTQLSFRPAQPADAAAIVPLIYDSSRDLYDYTFAPQGKDPRQFIEHVYLANRGFCGVSYQHVAVTPSGELVGTATLYTGRASDGLVLETAREAMRYFGLRRFGPVLLRAVALAPLFARPTPDALFLANCCVAPTHRGRGVFSALWAHLLTIRRPACVELDVSLTNRRAATLYRRLGFRTIVQNRTRAAGLDGFARMRLDCRA